MLLTVLLQAAEKVSETATSVFGNGDMVRALITFATACIVFAAAWGLGKIGKSAMDAIARQPESAGNVRTAMILAGALVEGCALFAIVVCFIAVNK